MKAVMVMFDSLNRHMLPPYGCEWVHAPNFERLAEPYRFTKGVRPLAVEARPWINAHPFGTLLFDLRTDPGQEHPLNDPEIESMMVGHLIRLMQANDAPSEQYERLGLVEGRRRNRL